MVDEDIRVTLERHDQHIKSLQHQVDDLKAVQTEIRQMNETLVTLTAEIKHTNEHLARHERQLDEIEHQPKVRLGQIFGAVLAAIAGGIVTLIVSQLAQ